MIDTRYDAWRSRRGDGDSDTLDKARQMGDFLRALYLPYERGWIEMRGLCPATRQPEPRPGAVRSRNGAWTWQKWYPLAETVCDPLAGFIQDALSLEFDGYDVYVGVLPRGKRGQSKKADIFEAGAVWVELDFDKRAGEEETTREARETSPDVIVHSGGGLHLYWTLKMPLSLNADTLRDFEAALRSRQRSMGADAVHDCTRILRVPGSRNYKYTPPRPVTLLTCPGL